MTAKYPELSSMLLAPIGKDAFGDLLVNELQSYKMRTDGLSRTDDSTAVCNMVLDSNGALVGGVADMGITKRFAADQVGSHEYHLSTELQSDLPLDNLTFAKSYPRNCRLGW
jgi:pseudouridine-5'-phosphate glycosidase/pseudouridine kinase